MELAVPFGKRAKCKISHLHPSEAARKIKRICAPAIETEELEVVDYAEYDFPFGTEEALKMRFLLDAELVVYALQSSVIIKEMVVSSQTGLAESPALHVAPVISPDNPQQDSRHDAKTTRASRVRTASAVESNSEDEQPKRPRKEICVGDKVRVPLRYLDAGPSLADIPDSSKSGDSLLATVTGISHQMRGKGRRAVAQCQILGTTAMVSCVRCHCELMTQTQHSRGARFILDLDSISQDRLIEGDDDPISDDDEENEDNEQSTTTKSGKTTWMPYTHLQTVDLAEYKSYRASITYHGQTPDQTAMITPLKMFMSLFPMQWLENKVIPSINETGQHKFKAWKPLMLSEMLSFLGIQLMMSLHIHQHRSVFWSEALPTRWQPAVRFRDVMERDRYDSIISAFTLPALGTQGGRLNRVLTMVQQWNSHMVKAYHPSTLLCLDEIMSAWTNMSTAPSIQFLPRKPKPLGSEYKAIADSQTGVLFNLELVQGKETTQHYDSEYGKTCALLCRMVENAGLTHKGHRIVLDSGFCVTRGLALLYERGVYACMFVKKKRGWPQHLDICNEIRSKAQAKPVGESITRRGQYSDGPDSTITPF
jgi:hypothetical protein